MSMGLLSLLLLVTMSLAQVPVSEYFASIISQDSIVSLTNEARKEKSRKPLKVSVELQAAAMQKAKDILEKQYFAHESPDQKKPWDFIDESGYIFRYAGENLAIHFQEAEDVTKGWLTSRNHRKNILSKKFSDIGIGIAKGKFQGVETTVVVQMFGRSMPNSWIAQHGTASKKLVRKEHQKAVTLAKEGTFSKVQGISAEQLLKNPSRFQMIWHSQKSISELYSFTKKYSETHLFVLPLVILLGTGIFLLQLKKKGVR